MAIISRGLKSTEFTHTCFECNTVFTYNILYDLIPLYGAERGYRDHDAWVKCPVCGKTGLFSADIDDLRKR